MKMDLSAKSLSETGRIWHRPELFINFAFWRAEEETGSAEEQPASNKLSAPHWTNSEAGGAAFAEAPLSACLGGASWLRKPLHRHPSTSMANVNNMLKSRVI